MNQINTSINYLFYPQDQGTLNNKNNSYYPKINVNSSTLPSSYHYSNISHTGKDNIQPIFLYDQYPYYNDKTINNNAIPSNNIYKYTNLNTNCILSTQEKPTHENNFFSLPNKSYFQSNHIGFLNRTKKEGHTRNRWTTEEEKKLIKLVSIVGPRQWNKISAFFANKTAKQCRDHYANCLNPEIRNSLWTEEEEEILLSKYKEYGSQWSKIKPFLPGRTASMIKNYGTMLIKRNNIIIQDKFQSTNDLQISNEQINPKEYTCINSSIESDIDHNIYLKMTDEPKPNPQFNYFDINSLLI